MISQELQDKLDFYEQYYFGLDKPIPFKGGLQLHPIKVSDYYNFYSCFGCLTMDKNTKMVQDGELGQMKKVSNPEGIGQSYLAYLISRMEEVGSGNLITNQVMQLFELVFHINKGLFCPKCGKEKTYQEVLEGMNEAVNEAVNTVKKLYQEELKKKEEELGESLDESKEAPKDLIEAVIQKTKMEYLQKSQECEDCKEPMRDIVSIKNNNGYKTLMVKNVEIGPQEFDELSATILRQNILDYDGDKYMDPELKEELEMKAKLQNSDYTSPTLEKQILSVAVCTGYSLEYLQSIPMRKLSLMLRLVDRKNTYYAQLQASLSGMVKFPEGSIKHWIFSDDKRNLKDELTDVDQFTKKFDQVT